MRSSTKVTETALGAHELLTIAGPLGFQVHVPKVVLEELVGHYSRRLDKAISAMSGHIADLAWLVDRELDYPIDESYRHNESTIIPGQVAS